MLMLWGSCCRGRPPAPPAHGQEREPEVSSRRGQEQELRGFSPGVLPCGLTHAKPCLVGQVHARPAAGGDLGVDLPEVGEGHQQRADHGAKGDAVEVELPDLGLGPVDQHPEHAAPQQGTVLGHCPTTGGLDARVPERLDQDIAHHIVDLDPALRRC